MAGVAVELSKTDFRGGIQQLVDSTQLPDDALSHAFNVRTRYGRVAPINKPLELELPESGNLQGVYGADNYLIVFLNGKAFYRNVANGLEASSFEQIAGFQLDPSVSVIYAQLVPASTLNEFRKLATSDISGDVTLTSNGDATPRCLIAQDGINQPWLITPDAQAREIQSYGDWSLEQREYVPIGKQMLFSGGILYVVSTNGESIYRSVLGRPLDFVVALDEDGNKAGDADVSDFKVSYGRVVCLGALNTQTGAFYVSTATASFLVQPNIQSRVWGQPSFDSTFLFSTGAVNQFSLVDVLGDTAVIDYTGIRSFNAVLQLQNEGRNAPFSANISPTLPPTFQPLAAACCVNFDNYAFFSVDSIYGPAVLVFDTLLQTFVSVDIYDGLTQISQFSEVRTATERLLFSRTTENKLYAMFKGGSKETSSLMIGQWGAPTNNATLYGKHLILTYAAIRDRGQVTITPYIDDVARASAKQAVVRPTTVITNPQPIPFAAVPDSVSRVVFDPDADGQGYKLGLFVQWDFDAELLKATVVAGVQTGRKSLDAEQEFEEAGNLEIVSVSLTNVPKNGVFNITGYGLSGAQLVYIGDMLVSSFSALSDTVMQIVAPSVATSGVVKVRTLNNEATSTEEVTVA